ncbi:Ecto-ADP-ribosyltransferase 3 [Lemmus lemmus]
MQLSLSTTSHPGGTITTAEPGKHSEPGHRLNFLQRHKHQKRKMKMGHFEMVTTLLAAMTLMDIFQVKAEVLDMAENSFDDEYLKCSTRMEVKYVPQLLKEERANDELLETVWSNAEILWNSRKAQISLPVNFKDPHGIALMAFLKEAQAQTPFYHEFNRDVTLTGQSRKDYIYNFPFKAFHFYLVRALQMLRRPCEDSYKEVVYLTHPDISTLEEQTQARLGNFTLAYSAKPTTASNEPVLTIYTCFGVDVGRFFEKERRGVVLIPLSEVFQVSSEGTGGNLLLQSMNSTCSYYECAYLGGLKNEECVTNSEYIEPVYIYNPGEYGLVRTVPQIWKVRSLKTLVRHSQTGTSHLKTNVKEMLTDLVRNTSFSLDDKCSNIKTSGSRPRSRPPEPRFGIFWKNAPPVSHSVHCAHCHFCHTHLHCSLAQNDTLMFI